MVDEIVLQNGSIGQFRPVQPADRDALVVLHNFLSDRRTYFRFIGLDAADAGTFIDGLLRAVEMGGAYSEVCLVGGNVVGIGTYMITDNDAAETVFVVDDRMHQLGIGTLLLERLADHAERFGIREFVSRVLSSNSAAFDVLAHSGFVGTTFDVGGEIEVRFPITMTERLANAVVERQDVANLASMKPLLGPKSVAVFSTSLASDSQGRALLENLSRAGFEGSIFPVVPEPDSTVTERTYPSIHTIPRQPVDLALLTLPAELVPGAIQACADADVRGVVIFSSGSSGIGAQGRERQERVLAIARTNGMRMIGPNSAGILNTAPEAMLDATMIGTTPESGSVALIAQSRFVGTSVLEQLRNEGVGISIFASLGDKVDVSSNDLLSYLAQDERTSVITMYVESVGNPRRFSRITRNITRTKPVVAMVGRPSDTPLSGQVRTDEAPRPTVADLFHQCGVIHVRSLEGMVDVTRLLSEQPLPKGRRVVVVSTSRGAAALTADAILDAGLELATLDQTLGAQISTPDSPAPPVSNPLILESETSVEHGRQVLRSVARSSAVDAVIIITPRSGDEPLGEALFSTCPRDIGETSLLAVGFGDSPASIARSTRQAVPFFRYPEDAAQALGLVANYAEGRRSPPDQLPEYDDLRPRTARELLSTVLRHLPDGRWLSIDETRQLLACYGVHTVATIGAAGVEQVLDAAAWVGFPVVLKTPTKVFEHRADIGGIRLDLTNRRSVREAYQDMAASDVLSETGNVIVQKQAPTGTELVIRVVYDESFGPLVVLAAGGRNAELFDDSTTLLTPVTEPDAASAVRRLNSSLLLFGYRGSTPADVRAVEDMIQRIGLMADDQPALDGLHLHVIAHPTGVAVVDAAARVRPPKIRARLTEPLDDTSPHSSD